MCYIPNSASEIWSKCTGRFIVYGATWWKQKILWDSDCPWRAKNIVMRILLLLWMTHALLPVRITGRTQGCPYIKGVVKWTKQRHLCVLVSAVCIGRVIHAFRHANTNRNQVRCVNEWQDGIRRSRSFRAQATAYRCRLHVSAESKSLVKREFEVTCYDGSLTRDDETPSAHDSYCYKRLMTLVVFNRHSE